MAEKQLQRPLATREAILADKKTAPAARRGEKRSHQPPPTHPVDKRRQGAKVNTNYKKLLTLIKSGNKNDNTPPDRSNIAAYIARLLSREKVRSEIKKDPSKKQTFLRILIREIDFINKNNTGNKNEEEQVLLARFEAARQLSQNEST